MSEKPEAGSGEGPGGPNRVVKAIGIAVLAFIVLYLLFTQVFPRVEGYLEDPTLGAPSAGPDDTAAWDAPGV